MCLITKQKKPIILTEDITVYKILGVRKDGSYYSSIRKFSYILNQCYVTAITKSQKGLYNDSIAVKFYEKFEDVEAELLKEFKNIAKGEDSIGVNFYVEVVVCNEGFHFYTDLPRIMKIIENFYSFPKKYHIMACTVPKGSEVYYDETGLGVANKIIIQNKVDITYELWARHRDYF